VNKTPQGSFYFKRKSKSIVESVHPKIFMSECNPGEFLAGLHSLGG